MRLAPRSGASIANTLGAVMVRFNVLPGRPRIDAAPVGAGPPGWSAFGPATGCTMPWVTARALAAPVTGTKLRSPVTVPQLARIQVPAVPAAKSRLTHVLSTVRPVIP